MRAARASDPTSASCSPARKESASDAPDGARTGTRRRGKKRESVVVVKPGIVLWNAVRLEEVGESVRLRLRSYRHIGVESGSPRIHAGVDHDSSFSSFGSDMLSVTSGTDRVGVHRTDRSCFS